MKKSIVKFGIILLLTLSFIGKALEFELTAKLLSGMLNISQFLSEILLILLLLFEIALVVSVILDYLEIILIRTISIGLLILFTIVNAFLFIKGEVNCGCFGAHFEISPIASFTKNLLFVLGIYFIAKKQIEEGKKDE